MKPNAIAIVGLAGRFPGARSVSEFWRNLRAGVESIRDCPDAELLAAGATVEDLANPAYVKRAAILDDVPLFDASFFGLSPRDASIMDPQHRHFLECAWEALEDAAHPPQSFQGAIGVFAGSGLNSYLIHNLLGNHRLLESAGLFQLKQTGNDKDVLATRVSYQFDLRGPSINVQTACSTSLVAVHLACQSLLNCECDMALAGGVTIEIPHGLGYLYREGEILSRDGHCRSFDASSSGTVFGSGVGIVVLRRLEDAISSRDHIRAVILGSAMNNDGARKVGFLAPSVDGQVEVLEEALEFAGVSADQISYVETHGTGTVVGDPIEIRALKQVFQQPSTDNSCGIGSAKTNVGHLDAAAGVTGLIKTVLALENRQIPPTLHFEKLNPHIDLNGTPFFIADRLTEWHPVGGIRRAGVTALGIGGTNVHVVLEEAPGVTPVSQQRPVVLLTASAKSEGASDRALSNLIEHLRSHPELDLADVAYSCQLGRQQFAHRRALAVENTPEAITAIRSESSKIWARGVASRTQPKVVFLFSGQGSQYIPMGQQLYRQERVFREVMDLCARQLKPLIGIDLIEMLYSDNGAVASEKLSQTWLTQPALFSIEYALAQWWMSLGVEPAAMLGHSIGEYVAACLAGVFSLEDALAIVALRGRLIYDLPAGAMLAVPTAADHLSLDPELSVAAINGPDVTVISGPVEKIAELEESLGRRSLSSRILRTSHAFHSAMMEPILSEFEDRLGRFAFHPPTRRYISNVTGTWITTNEAQTPAYWARHIRQTVRFAEGLTELIKDPSYLFIEAGPGSALISLVRAQGLSTIKAYQTLPHPRETISDLHCALQTLGHLWTAGVEIDWARLYPEGPRNRVSLPTYPFDHQKFWIEPDRVQPQPVPAVTPKQDAPDETALHLYRRVWRPAPLTSAEKRETGSWLVFRDAIGLGDRIVAQLHAERHDVVVVNPGSRFARTARRTFTLRPGVREDYDALLAEIVQQGLFPSEILHLWSVTDSRRPIPTETALERSFTSPLYLAQGLAAKDIGHAHILFVSNGLQQTDTEDVRDPARAVLLGPARLIPKELPGILCRAVDIDFEVGYGKVSAAELIAEMSASEEHVTTAYRGGKRLVETLEPFDLAGASEMQHLEHGGVYLITGGLGGLGLAVAEHLARSFKARLILLGRTAVPPEGDWHNLLGDKTLSARDRQRFEKLIAIRTAATDLMVVAADVSNPDDLRAAVSLARRHFGKIDGVFHAAGVLEDGQLLLKTADVASKVFGPKVQGTLALDEVLRGEVLHCFVLFSSISSIFPPEGQVDYAAANAFLDAFALSRGGSVVSLDWDAWSNVGMAARITISHHPLLGERLSASAGNHIYSSQIAPSKEWLLAEHRLKTGQALLPGTGYMEMAAAAFFNATFNSRFEMTNVLFLAPLALNESESRELRVELRQDEAETACKGGYSFSIFGHTDRWIEQASGHIAPCLAGFGSAIDRRAIERRCDLRELIFDEKHRTRQERHFDFGPRWHCLKSLRIGETEALAELELDERFHADLANFRIHPALLDMATGCSLYQSKGYDESDDLFLPFSYKQLRMYRPLPARFYSHIRHARWNRPDADLTIFNLSLFDAEGQGLAEIEGFAMRRLKGAENVGEIRNQIRESVESRQPIVLTRKPTISVQHGTSILTRILSVSAPSALVVAATPLTTPASRVAPSAPRVTSEPDLGVEETLTGWFEEMLGVQQVGLEDDFFAMGGHSLIGVRLFAKIQNKYKVNLELAVLFEARTVQALAKLVREKVQASIGTPRRSSLLVPIQPHGSKIPLFMIHAIGGEVLFYEPLARALGPDQPLYAVQSLLTSQLRMRESSMEELASSYVREIRSLLPHGPYLLGGHSYGGLVAYEMARQLHAQGADPALLVMIDAVVPGSQRRLPRSLQISQLSYNLREEGPSYVARKASLKRIYLTEKLVHRFRLLTAAAYAKLHRPLPPRLRYAQMEELHLKAMKRYRFVAYEGKISLIRATNRGTGGVVSLSEVDDPALGWSDLARGGLEIHDVTADHMNILLEPQAASVAKALNAMLSRVDKRQSEALPAI